MNQQHEMTDTARAMERAYQREYRKRTQVDKRAKYWNKKVQTLIAELHTAGLDDHADALETAQTADELDKALTEATAALEAVQHG